MKVDIDRLSTAELEKLTAQIEQRKADLAQEKLHKALEDMQAVATKHGVAFGDVIKLYSGASKKPKALQGEPKYQNPNNAKQTWTGKGRKPNWVVEGLEAGKSLEDFTI